MDYNNDYVVDEINLKEVFGQALKAWKRYLIVGLVLAVALGAYKFLPAYNIYKDEEKSAEYVLKNDQTIGYLENAVENLEYEIEKQEEYFNQSIYARINPIAVQKGTLSFYVSTPQTGAEFDYAEDVVHAYTNLFESGYLVSEVTKNLSYEVEDKYIDELISLPEISTEVTANYLDITIVHHDAVKLQEIMDLVEQVLKDNEISIRNRVGEYEITKVSENIAVVTDDAMKAERLALDTALDTLESELDTKEAELASAKKAYISQSSIIKNTIVFALVGFVLGMVACCGAQAVYIVLSSKIISANQLRDSMKIAVLGDFVSADKTGKLDRFACKLVGENVDGKYDEVLKVSAYNMVSFTEKKEIVVLDLVDSEKSTGIADDITKFDFAQDITFTTGKNTLDKFETLEQLGENTAVVLIAKKLGTKTSKLEREISIIRNYNAEFVGVILL